VLVTGYRSSPSACVLQGLSTTLAQVQGRACLESLLHDIDGALTRTREGNPPDSHAIAGWVAAAIEEITSPDTGYSGLFFVIDELGKSLEYAAHHPHESDVFILQELAELANRSEQTPLIFLGILHQAFDQYSQHLAPIARNEWTKVQGRFEDIVFQEPPDQMMRLLAAALSHPEGLISPDVEGHLRDLAQEAFEYGFCPPGMRPEEFYDLAVRSYPLHPSALAALPYVFRRFAQNERSLFSYLSSGEPFGFQEFLKTHRFDPDEPPFIRLPQVFDYIVATLRGGIFTRPHARRLVEAVDSLDRLHDLQPTQAQLVKAIGLLGALGEMSHLRASEQMIEFSLAGDGLSSSHIQGNLMRMLERSVFTYRKFNNSYRLWDGSDIDIEQRLSEARSRIGSRISIAQTIARYLPSRPLVARRHSFETGTLRYFEILHADRESLESVLSGKQTDADGRIVCCLPATTADIGLFEERVKSPEMAERDDVVIAIPQRVVNFVEAANELYALHWVSENAPELRDDRVARREVAERIAEVEKLLVREIERLMDPRDSPKGSGCRWYHRGIDQKAAVPADVTRLLSYVCDHLYPGTPRIWNELVNRRSLSSAAAAARRNLLEHMLKNGDRPILGMQGYPPERSMYESVLRATGIHWEEAGGNWAFHAPDPMSASRLRPCWDALEEAIFADPPEPRPVDKLFEMLRGRPYGLTNGVLPVLLCAFLKVHGDETTLYREGTFLPEPGIADFEVLTRRPELFAVAGCRITGERAAVIQRFARGLNVSPAAVPVVRALIRMVKSLPDHAWKTRRLPQAALAVREAFNHAQSPERLLFQDLPMALGITFFSEQEVNEDRIETFFSALNSTLQALGQATPQMIRQARDQLLEACGLSAGQEGWADLRAKAAALEGSIADPVLIPFIQRAAMMGDDNTILESVLAQVSNRPPRSWTDTDADRFPAQARMIGSRFRQAVAMEEHPQPLHLKPQPMRPEEKDLSQEIARQLQSEIKKLCPDSLPSHVLRAALVALLEELDADTLKGGGKDE